MLFFRTGVTSPRHLRADFETGCDVKLKDILKIENVIPNMVSRTRDEVISELVEAIADEVPLKKEELVKILIEREDQSPTAMGGGVAIPHGRIESLDRFILAVGRCTMGVQFGAKDSMTKIFFLLLAPVADTVNHLKFLARIARLCRKSGLLDDIISAGSAAEIYQRLMEEDEVT